MIMYPAQRQLIICQVLTEIPRAAASRTAVSKPTNALLGRRRLELHQSVMKTVMEILISIYGDGEVGGCVYSQTSNLREDVVLCSWDLTSSIKVCMGGAQLLKFAHRSLSCRPRRSS